MTQELNIPAAFARYRAKFGLSKAAFARAIGIAPQSYDYETPSKGGKMPGANKLFRIARCFNTSVDYLLGLTDDPRPVNQILAETQTPAPSAEKVLTLESLQAQLDKQAAEIEALKAKFLA